MPMTCLLYTSGGTYTYAYDGCGNLLELTDAEGHTTTYRYNERGMLLSETDAAGDTRTYTYDALGNLLSETVLLIWSMMNYWLICAGRECGCRLW